MIFFTLLNHCVEQKLLAPDSSSLTKNSNFHNKDTNNVAICFVSSRLGVKSPSLPLDYSLTILVYWGTVASQRDIINLPNHFVDNSSQDVVYFVSVQKGK